MTESWLPERSKQFTNLFSFTSDNILKVLCEHLAHVGHLGRAVELGSHRGGATVWLASVCEYYKFTPLVCVDTWKGSPNVEHLNQDKIEGYGRDEDIYDTFINVVKTNNLSDWVRPIQSTTIEAASTFTEDISFVFIDACHYYENVLADINAWVPKVVKGGIISFHDYADWAGTGGPERAIRETILSKPETFRSFSNPPDKSEIENLISFEVIMAWEDKLEHISKLLNESITI